MKKQNLIYIILAAVLFFDIPVYAQTSSEAASYMGEISEPFGKMKNETWAYLKAVTRGKSARKIDSKRQALLTELNNSKSSLSKKSGFQGDNSLKLAVVEYMDISYKVLNEDFDKIMDMEDIAEQSYDLMEAYLLAKETASKTLDKASDDYNEVYKAFANEYGVNIVEGEADKKSLKIKQASESLGYYNDYYLIFFKSYKQEAYALDALGNGDISGIEQNANSLVEVSVEGIEKARVSQGFHGDNSLKYGTQEVLAFYKNEGEKDFKVITDFHIKKSNFERLQKVIDSKSKKDKTQQDLDQYNKAVAEYNEAINQYNQTIESMNKKRTESLKAWNKRVQDFFDKHS